MTPSLDTWGSAETVREQRSAKDSRRMELADGREKGTLKKRPGAELQGIVLCIQTDKQHWLGHSQPARLHL